MVKNKSQIFFRLGNKWLVKPAFLEDVYYLMLNDLRFSSLRTARGIRYSKVSEHLYENYQITLSPAQLKYLVSLVSSRKKP